MAKTTKTTAKAAAKTTAKKPAAAKTAAAKKAPAKKAPAAAAKKPAAKKAVKETKAPAKKPAASNKVTLTINGKEVTVPAGTTINAAAKMMGVKIPSLCYSPDLKPWASCGLCVIKNVDPRTGRARMARSCCTAVTPGMNIITDDAELRKARRTVLELILSNHPNDCLKCSRNHHCELQELASSSVSARSALTGNSQKSGTGCFLQRSRPVPRQMHQLRTLCGSMPEHAERMGA
jgi:predicted molibdopterin-dependent oxidoreductase YjgC